LTTAGVGNVNIDATGTGEVFIGEFSANVFIGSATCAVTSLAFWEFNGGAPGTTFTFINRGLGVGENLRVGAVTPTGTQTRISNGATLASIGLLVDNSAQIVGNLTVGGLLVQSVIQTGFNTAALTSAGLFGYQSSGADYTLLLTDAATYAKSQVIGVSTATGGQAIYDGLVVSAKFSTAGGAPTRGAPAYIEVAANDAGADGGKLTVTAPTTPGQVVAYVGTVLGNIAGAGPYTADVELHISAPIQI